MIILSDKTDIFSNRVENWLKLKGEECFRINTEEPIDQIYIELIDSDFSIRLSRKVDNVDFSISESKVWHRRGGVNFDIPFKQGEIDMQVHSFLCDESNSLSNAILMCLEEKGLLVGKNIVEKGNKLFNLHVASKCGLNIPKTFITNRKEKLLDIHLQHPKLITKPISDNFLGKVNGKNLIGFVGCFDDSVFEQLPDTFFPTLFQEKIERDFELRSFFFCGNIFSMATFLAKEDSSISDIKQIEIKKKRYVPYKLPNDVSKKALDLLARLDLDTASFDFVVDKNGNIYFLELNQYGLLNEMSYHCNYSIEEFVANKLIDNGR